MVKKHQLIFGVLLIVLWEVIALTGKVPSLYEIGLTLLGDFEKILLAIFNSLTVIMSAILLSVVLTAVLTLISQKDIFDDWVDLLITICHPIPGVALLPLVFIWVGPGKEAIFIIVVHAVLWPLLINVKQEVKRVKLHYKEVMTVFKVSRKNQLLKIYGLGGLPGLISGLKIGWSRGWRGFISAEMIFSVIGDSSGIGWYIFKNRVFGQTSGVFAGIISIILISLLMEKIIFRQAEKHIDKRWVY